MKYTYINQLRAELSTFADDVDDVVYEADGSITFEKQGQIVSLQLFEKNEKLAVKYEGKEYSYKEFLAYGLAHLDLFAKRILQYDNADEEQLYVDPDSDLVRINGQKQGKAKDILQKECDNPAWLGARIVFVTADAGHGKSFLLRQFQREQARKYLEKKTDYLFWHIDLHGRELVRLNEAIMYELSALRISGLYYNSIITLIKNGLIILGIDGFDELAAEKGGDVALGSLTNLVTELGGDGIIVAASRRTFFNTQDYIQRAGLMNQRVNSDCEFNEIRLQNWGESQCVKYLNCYYPNAQLEYSYLKGLFQSSANHPLLERPFLFTKIVKFAYQDNKTPYEFVSHGGGNDLDSINNIIGAFVKREVYKWSTTEKDTGKPYLDFDQHMRLLSEVANEMWVEQKDNISIDTIAFILTILFDEWKTDVSLRPRITKMAESHALLPISSAGDKYRRFDHDEFRNFFLSLAFSKIIKGCIEKGVYAPAYSFIKIAQLPDTVSQYLILQLKKEETEVAMNGLLKLCQTEIKSTYAQPNIGTLMPYFLDQIRPTEMLEISGKIVYSSLVFENKNIANVTFRDSTFINISFKNTQMENVRFESCTFSEIKFNNISHDNSFKDVLIEENCSVNKVTIYVTASDYYSEYSPGNINNLLFEQGISRKKYDSGDPCIAIVNSDFRKTVKRFLNKYNSSSYQFEKNIKDDPLCNSRKCDMILEDIIPMLISHGILEEVVNSKTQQANTKAWRLKHYNVSDIYKAEEDETSPLYPFWQEVNHHE